MTRSPKASESPYTHGCTAQQCTNKRKDPGTGPLPGRSPACPEPVEGQRRRFREFELVGKAQRLKAGPAKTSSDLDEKEALSKQTSDKSRSPKRPQADCPRLPGIQEQLSAWIRAPITGLQEMPPLQNGSTGLNGMARTPNWYRAGSDRPGCAVISDSCFAHSPTQRKRSRMPANRRKHGPRDYRLARFMPRRYNARL